MKNNLQAIALACVLSATPLYADNVTTGYDEDGKFWRAYSLMPTNKAITDEDGVAMTMYKLWDTGKTLLDGDGVELTMYSTAPSDQNLAEMRAKEFNMINTPAFEEAPVGLPAAAGPRSVYPDLVGP